MNIKIKELNNDQHMIYLVTNSGTHVKGHLAHGEEEKNLVIAEFQNNMITINDN